MKSRLFLQILRYFINPCKNDHTIPSPRLSSSSLGFPAHSISLSRLSNSMYSVSYYFLKIGFTSPILYTRLVWLLIYRSLKRLYFLFLELLNWRSEPKLFCFTKSPNDRGTAFFPAELKPFFYNRSVNLLQSYLLDRLLEIFYFPKTGLRTGDWKGLCMGKSRFFFSFLA